MTNKPNEGQKVPGRMSDREIYDIVQRLKVEFNPARDGDSSITTRMMDILRPYLSALPPKPVQDVLQQCVAALEDAEIWVASLREGVNKWGNGNCGIDARMETLEGWVRSDVKPALTAAREQMKEGV